MRLILLLAASTLAFGLPAHAQENGAATLTFNHLALSVKDLDRSADFYGRVLSLSELSREQRSEGVRWFSLGGGQELHLISHEFFRGDDVRVNKAVHLSLTTNRFVELLARLDSNGVAYGDWSGTPKAVETRSDGVSQVFLQDPDGYWIEVNNVVGRQDETGGQEDVAATLKQSSATFLNLEDEDGSIGAGFSAYLLYELAIAHR